MMRTPVFLFGIIFIMISVSADAEWPELPDLGARAIPNFGRDLDPANPQFIPTTARFFGGVSVDSNEQYMDGLREASKGEEAMVFITSSLMPAQVRFRIHPAPEHLGRTAKISVLAGYFPMDANFFMNFIGLLTQSAIYSKVSSMGLAPLITLFSLNEYSHPIFLANGDGRWDVTQLASFRMATLQPSHNYMVFEGNLPDGFIFLFGFYVLENGTTVMNKTIPSIFVMKINNRKELEEWRGLFEVLWNFRGMADLFGGF